MPFFKSSPKVPLKKKAHELYQNYEELAKVYIGFCQAVNNDLDIDLVRLREIQGKLKKLKADNTVVIERASEINEASFLNEVNSIISSDEIDYLT